MSNPTPYTVTYSFAGFQANNPTTPLPAPALDNELASIATAIAQLGAFAENVIRPDGALQNGIVTFASLESALQLLTDPTNGQLVAAAVAGAQASATSASGSAATATAQAIVATAQAVAAAASAGTVNLSLYLAKANNLAGLGSLSTSRGNLGLGNSAVLDAGVAANNVVQLDGGAKLPAVDGSQLTGVDILPVGSIIWLPSITAPASFLKVNGALVARATYPRLWTFANGSGNIVAEAAWAGAREGSFTTGDLTTTFRVPDLRGTFVRGFDDARGLDTGRVIGSNQADSLKDHTHNYNQSASTTTAVAAAGHAFGDAGGSATATGSPSTGAAAETRPKNIALLACIKY